MRKIKEVIVVEGRYDKNTLSQIVDATVVTLGGFAVFNDREKVAFLRRLAEERGLIVLTDSDGAGFVIRNYLKGALPRDRVSRRIFRTFTARRSGSAPPARRASWVWRGCGRRSFWRPSAAPALRFWMKRQRPPRLDAYH